MVLDPDDEIRRVHEKGSKSLKDLYTDRIRDDEERPTLKISKMTVQKATFFTVICVLSILLLVVFLFIWFLLESMVYFTA